MSFIKFSEKLKNMSIKDITLKISKENNISKKVVYDFCLKKKLQINLLKKSIIKLNLHDYPKQMSTYKKLDR